MRIFKIIVGLFLMAVSIAAFGFFDRIGGSFMFLSGDGAVVPHSLLQMRLCLIAVGVIGLYLLFTGSIRSFLNRINTLLMQLKLRQFLLIVLSAAFVLRAAAVIVLPIRLWIDYQTYHELARDWAVGGCFCVDGLPTAYRPPGYPFFLSSIYRLFGANPEPGAVANIFLSILIVLLIYLLIRRLLGEKPARWTAVIIAFFPSQILFTNLLASETLFTVLFLLALLLLTAEHSVKYILLGGIVLGLAALTRPLILIFPIFLILYWYLRDKKWQAVIINTLIALLGLIIVVTPWVIRNRHYDKGTVISTNAGVNLLIGNQPGSGMGWNQPVTEDLPLGDPTMDRYVDSVGRSRAWAYIKNDPPGFIKRGFLKLLYFYAVDMEGVGFELVRAADNNRFDIFVIIGLITESYYLMILFAALIGIISLIFLHRDQLRPGHYLIFLTIIYWSGVHFIFFADGRFHFPIVPLLTVLAVRGLFAGSGIKHVTSGT